MTRIGPVLFVVGILLTILALAMCVPMIADASVNHPDWRVFAGASALTLFVGVALILTRRPPRVGFTVREAFALTAISWLAIAGFASLPFAFADIGLGYTDAFFEAMSGLTTTGSTVLDNLDTRAPGILLWRSTLQWLGGIGIVVMAIMILPFLRVGGMQLFRTESSERAEKVIARPSVLVSYLAAIYVALSAACAIAYRLAGMSAFDAINHAMTTLATGGYSTHDASLGYFEQPAVHWVAIVFIIAGSLPFFAYIRMIRGESLALWRSSQARLFICLIAAFALILAPWLHATSDLPFGEALRLAIFNVVSIASTTGYANDDYSRWGAFAVGVFFLLTFVGGCTGSTAGAIKMFRFHILWIVARDYLRTLIYPHRVHTLHYNGRPVPEDVPASVLAFLFVYLGSVAVLGVALSAYGLDLETSLSAAATAVGNVGPGLGPIIGPAGNFAPLPDGAKWLLSFGMLLGRLELFTILVLLQPEFWRW